MGPAEPQATSLATTLPIFLPCQATLKGHEDSFRILPALSWKPNLTVPGQGTLGASVLSVDRVSQLGVRYRVQNTWGLGACVKG